MKITFDNQTRMQMQQAGETYKNFSKTSDAAMAGQAYMISPAQTTKTTYETGKTGADIMNASEAMSLTDETDRLVVLSHTMSEEDYAAYCKDGDLSDYSPEDAVTMLDHIKMDLVKGGTQIEGFTDDLPPELEKEVKQAEEKASELTEMTDGMKKVLVTTGEDLTIDNLYLARFSGGEGNASTGASYFTIEAPGYLAMKAEPVDRSVLKDQVAGLLTTEDHAPTEEEVDAGLWLVDNSICVNQENVDRYLKVDSLELPLSDEQLDRAIDIALVEGKNPKDADLTKTENIYEEAARLTDEILNLEDSQVHAARVLEEARLKMTTEANLQLLKSGVKIDTTDLEAYVEALKSVENTKEYQESRQISEVKDTIATVKSLPAAVIGRMMAIPDADLTLKAVQEEGTKLKESYDSALVKYEQVSTEVRPDLGDSIKKAFQNVDDILSEEGIEVNEENRRAVRILGYNSMAITKESVQNVTTLDRKLNHVLEELTPKDTLELIRKGSSPVTMSVSELDEYLTEQESSEEAQMEKYSKFLYKLEQNDAITQEERGQYIEVYRLLYQLESTDYAAIGGLLKTGKDLTFGNLKEEIRTAKHVGTDVKVDDSFGFLVTDLEKEIEPERLKAAAISDNTTLHQAYDEMVSTPKDQEAEEEYAKEQYKEFKAGIEAGEDSILELLSNNEPVTISRMAETELLLHSRGRAFKNVSKIRGDEFDGEIEELTEDFDEEDEASEDYAEMMDHSKTAVFEAAMASDSYLDVRELTLTHKQLSLAASFAEEETYNVPMEVAGEMTDVCVKLVHNEEAEPSVAVSCSTEYLGKVTARFTIEDGKTKGYIACNYKDAVTDLEKAADIMGEDISVIYSKDTDRDFAFSRLPMKDNSDAVSSRELYQTAKKFLKAIGEI